MAKKLINDPHRVVRESLEGVVLTRPGIALLGTELIVVRTDRLVGPDTTGGVGVALISGGGAGHEPAHAGYVGSGMLTAAVSGEVFASPGVDAILQAIRAVTGRAGCLLIVKSYTGDRLNFGLAAEIARGEGLAAETVVVADDVAITESDANAGRRGLAGTVLVEKAAGALAESGAPLADVAALARAVARSVGTIGVGLSGVTLPGESAPGFVLADDEIEVGLGIHGEPGVAREPLRQVDHLVEDLVHRIVVDRGLDAGDRVAALVGSAGATPAMELNIVCRALARAAEGAGLVLERLWQGPVMTSLDMAGVSISLLALPPGPAGDQLLGLLDAATPCTAWPGRPGAGRPHLVVASPPSGGPPGPTEASAHDAATAVAIGSACRALLAQEAYLTQLDSLVGDGDLGSALARGARAWLEDPVSGSATDQLRTLAQRVRRTVGGTSGPLYAMGLLGASDRLASGGGWPDALRAGLAAVQQLGGAEAGDRTMVDALLPAADAADAGVRAAAEAARRGAESTRSLSARRGRSSYLGDRVHGEPDPGAVAVAVWLEALA